MKDLELKPRPGDEGARLFHYFEAVHKTTGEGTESLEFEQRTALEATEYEEAARGIESGPESKRRRSLPSSGSAPARGATCRVWTAGCGKVREKSLPSCRSSRRNCSPWACTATVCQLEAT